MTAKTDLPEGTRYRLYAERWIRVRGEPAKVSEGITLKGMKTNAGEFRPVDPIEIADPPGGPPFASLTTFGAIKDGTLRADIVLPEPSRQVAGANEDLAHYVIDTQHLFVRGRIDKSVQPEGVAIRWPEGVASLDFILQLDVRLYKINVVTE